ncbi:MAG: hypothetical protein QGG40_14170 [Myxococcota bacterium]|jgi:hypothetical protein|nr:hypothetical protein [Myxococcota bacterium]
MRRSVWCLVLGAVLSGCGPSGVYEGRLVNAMTGEACGAERVLLRATSEDTDMTCRVLETTTSAEGAFRFEGTCKGTSYTMEFGNGTLFAPEVAVIEGGEASAGPVEVRAWRAPAGEGVYILESDKLIPVRTATDVDRETFMEGDDEVILPRSIPKEPTRVSPGSYLTLANKELVDHLEIHPLVPHTGQLRFSRATGFVNITDFAYVGTRFRSSTDYERVTATLDTSKVRDVSSDTWSVDLEPSNAQRSRPGAGRWVRYIGADALPAGRYVLMGEGDRRMYILEFGAE